MPTDQMTEEKTTTKYCTNCGEQREVNAQTEKTFCQYCGTKFDVSEASKDMVKKGAMESALNFVKKKIEEEIDKRRKNTIKLIKKNWKILLGIFIGIILIISFGIMNESEDKNDENKIAINSSSSDFKGKNYGNIVTQLQKTGFTNIKTEELSDLVTGWLTKDGEVKQVAINGTTVFNASSIFPKDAQIVITYHTFPKKKTDDTTSAVKENSAPSLEINQKEITNTSVPQKEKVDTTSAVKENSAPSLEINQKEITNTSVPKTEKVEPTSAIKEISVKPVESNQEILRVESNKDLANLLKVKDNSDPRVREFAKKYAGKTIEFNGNIADVMRYENYKTRFKYLIYVGDYSETSAIGPSFQFKDVNYYDLHFTGSNIPESATKRLNIHIIAKILEYDEKSSLFLLEPISTQMR